MGGFMFMIRKVGCPLGIMIKVKSKGFGWNLELMGSSVRQSGIRA